MTDLPWGNNQNLTDEEFYNRKGELINPFDNLEVCLEYLSKDDFVDFKSFSLSLNFLTLNIFVIFNWFLLSSLSNEKIFLFSIILLSNPTDKVL